MVSKEKSEVDKMKNQITLGQLLASIAAILISVFGAWMTLNKDVVKWSSDQVNLRVELNEVKLDIKDTKTEQRNDMKEIRETLYRIEEKVNNKKDR